MIYEINGVASDRGARVRARVKAESVDEAIERLTARGVAVDAAECERLRSVYPNAAKDSLGKRADDGHSHATAEPPRHAADSFSITSTSLIERVKAQDPEGWRRFVEIYGQFIFRLCRRAGLDDHDAADVTQEVFRAAAGRIASFRRTTHDGTLRGWLVVITRNKLVDHTRQRVRQPQAVGGSDAHARLAEVADAENSRESDLSERAADPSPDVGPESFLEASSQLACVAVSKSDLSEIVHRAATAVRVEFEDRTWKAFWLTAVERRAAADVATELAMTTGAVRQAKYKVLRRLRQEIGDVD